jgi:RNA polymerase sigma-70 factor (ECF subfamily)
VNYKVDYAKVDDKTLIRLIVQAREEALSELYDRYSRLVFSVAVHIVGHQAIAEEITLDIFTRVWQKAHTYRPERAKVSTWLTSMTRYRAIDQLRREDVRPEKHSLNWADVWPEPASTKNNPETAAHLALERQRLRAALAQLPPEQKEVLAWSYFKGYSHSQIAAELDQPLGTVKTRIRLAMQKLRRMLREG